MKDETQDTLPRIGERIRLPVKLRRLTVARVTPLSPHMARITFTGEDLADFQSPGFGDHVKLMLPQPGQAAPDLPTLGPEGPVMAEGAVRPVMRDYTPRRFDPAARELDIEFVLHEDGPAGRWAAQAAPGQVVGVGGPRGSLALPDDLPWHLLIGDESALPAIARRLEELPESVPVFVRIHTADRADRRELTSAAALNLAWSPTEVGLIETVRKLALPPGRGFAWVAAESSLAQTLRRVLLEEVGLDKGQVRAQAYWKRGEADHHDKFED
ncbi:siderophore-interacting protein [Niveibacterium sp. SC-1]|uniref:siderophore-interacting protein n=1 Tax=Niveibacterium sp. SC-1 TaxID=3135646 RepID=UPI00311F5DDD